MKKPGSSTARAVVVLVAALKTVTAWYCRLPVFGSSVDTNGVGGDA